MLACRSLCSSALLSSFWPGFFRWAPSAATNGQRLSEIARWLPKTKQVDERIYRPVHIIGASVPALITGSQVCLEEVGVAQSFSHLTFLFQAHRTSDFFLFFFFFCSCSSARCSKIDLYDPASPPRCRRRRCRCPRSGRQKAAFETFRLFLLRFFLFSFFYNVQA